GYGNLRRVSYGRADRLIQELAGPLDIIVLAGVGRRRAEIGRPVGPETHVRAIDRDQRPTGNALDAAIEGELLLIEIDDHEMRKRKLVNHARNPGEREQGVERGREGDEAASAMIEQRSVAQAVAA